MPELGVTQLGCQVSLLEVILHPFLFILYHPSHIPSYAHSSQQYTRVIKNPTPSKANRVH